MVMCWYLSAYVFFKDSVVQLAKASACYSVRTMQLVPVSAAGDFDTRHGADGMQ